MKRFLSFLFLLPYFTSLANAQTADSVRTETTTEDARISAAEVKRFIRYITRADVEERTLFKVGIWPASDRTVPYEYRRWRLGADFEVLLEQKLSPSLSFLFGIEGSGQYAEYQKRAQLFGLNPPSQPNGAAYYLEFERRYELLYKAGFRYYYNKHKQILSGLSANNFSGNYLTIQGTVPWEYKYQQGFRNVSTSEQLINGITGRQTRLENTRILFAYGLQRRLGKYAYFDVNAGPEVLYKNYNGKTSFSFQLNALVGFGW